MKSFRTVVMINAAPVRIWQILGDLSDWPSWNVGPERAGSLRWAARQGPHISNIASHC